VSVAGNVVTLARSGNASIPAGQTARIVLRGVSNPAFPGSTGPFQVRDDPAAERGGREGSQAAGQAQPLPGEGGPGRRLAAGYLAHELVGRGSVGVVHTSSKGLKDS
jgi:hypothetical protein